MTLVQFWKNWHGRRVCSLSPGCNFIKILHIQKMLLLHDTKNKILSCTQKNHPTKKQTLRLCLLLINMEVFFFMFSKYMNILEHNFSSRMVIHSTVLVLHSGLNVVRWCF